MARKGGTDRSWPKPRTGRLRASRAFVLRFKRVTKHFLHYYEQGRRFDQSARRAGVTPWTVRRWIALGAPGNAVAGRDDMFMEFRAAWLKLKRSTLS